MKGPYNPNPLPLEDLPFLQYDMASQERLAAASKQRAGQYSEGDCGGHQLPVHELPAHDCPGPQVTWPVPSVLEGLQTAVHK